MDAGETLSAVNSPTAERRAVGWEHAALLAILAIAAALYCWSLGSRALQPYYAAAVHSMSRDFTAFLFAGYDPNGVVSLDKPPLAFWVQTLGVWVFGYHWWAIALVQAAEGVAAVFVLHRVVRRWAGEGSALLAALLLALSPITTAIDRDNVPDTLMILLLLLAAYCVTRAVQHGRTGWLVACGGFVGLAFLTKMLAGWLVLPGLALAYLAAPVGRSRRAGQLLAAGVVMAAVSFSWPLLVSLWPGARPFVGSTTDDSVWQLIFNYNGLGRVVGASAGSLSVFGGAVGGELGGRPGPLRLFDTEVAGQIAWLLPVAVGAVVVAVVARLRGHRGEPGQSAGWLLWGGWLAACAGVFSFTSGIFHPYYTAELAPAVAALAATGTTVSWRWYRDGRLPGLLLPAAVAVTAALAFVVLDRTPSWLPWLRTAVVLVAATSVVALFVAFPGWRRARGGAVLVPAGVIGLLAMLGGPAAFAADAAGSRTDVLSAADPSAGPSSSSPLDTVRAALGANAGNGNAALAYLRFMGAANHLDPGGREVLDYVLRTDPGARITLAVEGGTYGADPFLINTDARVVALGGYLGLDPAPTAAQLAGWTGDGELRFVLLPRVFLEMGRAASGGPGAQVGQTTIAERIGWLTRHCAVVPPARIGPASATTGVLFDCGH